jgi:aspartate/tyrosine/aromatic aminotransferase
VDLEDIIVLKDVIFIGCQIIEINVKEINIFLFIFTQVATVQGLSGTGSLRLGAALINRYFPGAKVVISNPTWGVHFFHFSV